MQRAVWGLPQAGILANKLLQRRLLLHGYFECNNTPGLWKHKTRPISFTLVVGDFGVKYVGKEHVNHLIRCIKKDYELTENWSGDLYCGIKLKWDYAAQTVDFSMPGYIKKSSKNTDITCQQSPNIAHSHPPQNNTVPWHKPPSPSTTHQNYLPRK